MKRYIEINGEISFIIFESGGWEINVNIEPDDVIAFFMELQLIEFYHSNSITIKSLKTGRNIIIGLQNEDNEINVELINDKFRIKLTHDDIGYISSYLLQYYRDSSASVSHIQFDVLNNSNIGTDGMFIISATVSLPPLSGEEAKKLLGI